MLWHGMGQEAWDGERAENRLFGHHGAVDGNGRHRLMPDPPWHRLRHPALPWRAFALGSSGLVDLRKVNGERGMWIFCKQGFVSIVKHRLLPGMLLVRARVRDDIENFVRLLDEISGKKHPVEETPDADYRFRTVACKRLVAKVVSRIAGEIDYPNFKDEVHGDRQRDLAYMKVWRAMVDFQAEKEEGPQ